MVVDFISEYNTFTLVNPILSLKEEEGRGERKEKKTKNPEESLFRGRKKPAFSLAVGFRGLWFSLISLISYDYYRATAQLQIHETRYHIYTVESSRHRYILSLCVPTPHSFISFQVFPVDDRQESPFETFPFPDYIGKPQSRDAMLGNPKEKRIFPVSSHNFFSLN